MNVLGRAGVTGHHPHASVRERVSRSSDPISSRISSREPTRLRRFRIRRRPGSLQVPAGVLAKVRMPCCSPIHAQGVRRVRPCRRAPRPGWGGWNGPLVERRRDHRRAMVGRGSHGRPPHRRNRWCASCATHRRLPRCRHCRRRRSTAAFLSSVMGRQSAAPIELVCRRVERDGLDALILRNAAGVEERDARRRRYRLGT